MKKLMLIAAVVLAGCGGGSDEPPVAVEDRSVPTSATASPAAYTEFVGSRPVENDLEPLLVQGVVPPASDDGEPMPLR
jgi:uncharacterized lipoprotein YmbA